MKRLVLLVSRIRGVTRMQSDWQNVFAQSRVNGGQYAGDKLPEQKWHWPADTWLKRKLKNHT
jgi:hypothetical protein